MPSKSKTQTRKSLNLSQCEPKDITEDEIDEMIRDITLKHPRSAYCLYIMENFKKEKDKNPEIKLVQVQQKYSSKWPKVSDKEKDKYQKQSESEKEKFKKDLETVKNYLIQNYVKEGATSYRIFLDTKLQEAFKNDEDPDSVKKAASDEWKNMSNEEKRKWNNLKKQNDTWWEKAKHSRTINAYAIFVQKKLEEARNADKKLAFGEISKLWKNVSNNEKKKLKTYADSLNEERKRIREIYEMSQGFKPKRPMGAFKIFLSEMAKQDKFKGKNPILEGKKLWKALTESEKDEYMKKSKRIKLTYEYRKMLYKQKIKKERPKHPLSAYTFFCKDMKNKKLPQGKSFLDYCSEKWNSLKEDEKKKYEQKSEKSKEIYEKEMAKFKNKVFDLPKRAKSAYQFYVIERYPVLQKEKPKADLSKISEAIGNEWNEMSNKEKKKFEKLQEQATEIYKKQLAEFKKQGYYTLKNKEERSQSKKKQSQKSSQSNKKNK